MSEVLWYWTGRGCGVPCIDTYNLICFIVDFVDASGGPERKKKKKKKKQFFLVRIYKRGASQTYNDK